MGIQERKRRRLAEREQVFLDHAWAMIQRDGLLNLQMARLAAECDYAVGTLYQHFSSKEDLLVALAARRTGERIELFERAAAWQAPSRSRMFAILIGDVLFAQRAPDFFRLTQYVSTHAVWAAASPQRRNDALEGSRPLGEAVQRVIGDAVTAGDIDSHGLSGKELCGGLWAMCVGMHALVSADGVLESQCVPRPYTLLQHHAHALLNGLGWRQLIPLDDVDAQRQLSARIVREVFPEFEVFSEFSDVAGEAASGPLSSCAGEACNE